MIRNILWDVDGTLFDTYPSMISAMDRALNELGRSVALDEIEALTRQSMDHCVDTLCDRFGFDPELLSRRFLAFYREVPLASEMPFPGVREVCALIHTGGGRNIAVTHRRVQSTQALLEVHGLAPMFHDILSSEQGYPRKPDAAIVVAALRLHGLDPVKTLMIGDRELDIHAGRAAGVRTCLFGGAALSEPADLHIDAYSQLLELLQRIDPCASSLRSPRRVNPISSRHLLFRALTSPSGMESSSRFSASGDRFDLL